MTGPNPQDGPDHTGAAASTRADIPPQDQTVDYRAPHDRTATATGAPSSKPEERGAAPFKHYGRYEVRGLLGRGGLGEVFIGFDPDLDRKVAIKVPRVRNASAQENLLKEARHVAQFSHGDRSGLRRRHSPGPVLHRLRVAEWHQPGEMAAENTTGWEEACRIVAAVADALGYAHARRTVHRDVKPDNIVLKEDLSPVLIDFGLAINDESSTEEQIGLIAGTFHYMSPEQASGLGHRIDGRTDIYSLGVVFYRMLTARIPFHSTDRHELLRQVRGRSSTATPIARASLRQSSRFA